MYLTLNLSSSRSTSLKSTGSERPLLANMTATAGLAALERRAVRDERALDAAQDVAQRVGEEGLGTAEVDADRAFRADGNTGGLQLADRLPHIRLRVN